ncbi:GspE/PulE family protein [Hyphobacterium sp.]|uniref:GspE/PulE family protein n=1 Tax=Hyphobacterium sp. TaxID=2004662 RepID=UPI003BAB74F8
MDERCIGDILLQDGSVSTDDIAEALAYQRETGTLIGQALLRLGAVAEERLLAALSTQLELDVLDAAEIPSDELALSRAPTALGLPLRWLTAKEAVIWFESEAVDGAKPGRAANGHDPEATNLPPPGATLVVAARNPLDPALGERIETRFDGPIRRVLVSNRSLDAALARLHDASARTKGEALTDAERLREMAEEAPVIDFVNALFEDAMRAGASDIHVEPYEHEYVVRLRIDGVLSRVQTQPRGRFDAVASRIKLISGMDIAERRLPQDGRQSIRFAGEDVDLRVSSLPGAWGESLVLRLLRKRQELPTLEGLGLEGPARQSFDRMIREPNGVVLVTGPTGSGKSTTLYRALEQVNDGEHKIITIEDPVEYDMDGVTQVQARADIGYSFARGLRAILRQDPDIIMIGEIRDGETARIAVQAALTGHLVFSTLHTNSALAAVERLTDLGVEPFLISASLRGLVAQRLLRRLCPACARPAGAADIKAAEALMSEAGGQKQGIPSNLLTGPANWQIPTGCPQCRDTGYTGRIAVFEAACIDGSLREAVAQGASADKLEAAAREGGYLSMFEDAMLKARTGVTSVSEVLRVLASNTEAGAPLEESGA